MNRRDILKFGGAAIFATVGSCVVVRGRAVAGSAFGGDRLHVAQQIVNESGNRWLAVRNLTRDTDPVLITFNDGWVYEADHKSDGWQISWRRINKIEQEELQEYFAKYPSRQLNMVIGEPCWRGSEYRTRGFIKHGRYPKSKGWTHSVEKIV